MRKMSKDLVYDWIEKKAANIARYEGDESKFPPAGCPHNMSEKQALTELCEWLGKFLEADEFSNEERQAQQWSRQSAEQFLAYYRPDNYWLSFAILDVINHLAQLRVLQELERGEVEVEMLV